MNTRVAVQYIEAWLGGNGAVPLYNLMEDAATAEISRTQNWQWVDYGASLVDGRKVTPGACGGRVTTRCRSLRHRSARRSSVGASRMRSRSFAGWF